MAIQLSEDERKVLETFVKLEETDPQGAWNCFYHEVVQAGGGNLDVTSMICRGLRRRKLLKGEGHGMNAAYWPSDKGKEVVANG